jgi:hypothetical protein
MAPMVVNEGTEELEQNFHHPETGQSAHNAGTTNTQRASGESAQKSHKNENIANAVNKIIACIKDNKKKESRRAIKGLMLAIREQAAIKQRAPNDNAPVTKGEFKNILKAALLNRLPIVRPNQTPPQHRSWAAVITGILSSDEAWQIKMVVPARRSRKLVVRSGNAAAPLRNKTPQEIIQTINTATGKSNAITAKTMQNGNVVITFETNADQKAQNTEWVVKAFGETASITRKKLAVIAKKLSASKLRNTYDEAKLATILRQNNNNLKIMRCKRFLFRNSTNKYAALILHLSDIKAAQKLYSTGLL